MGWQWHQPDHVQIIRTSLQTDNHASSSSLSSSYTPFTRYNWLSNRMYNRFDNRLYCVNKHPNGWQPVWQPCWTNSHCSWTNSHCSFNRLSNPVSQPCWTNSCSFNRLSNRVVQLVWQAAVYTIQPLVKPVWQPALSCKRGFTMQMIFLTPNQQPQSTESIK